MVTANVMLVVIKKSGTSRILLNIIEGDDPGQALFPPGAFI